MKPVTQQSAGELMELLRESKISPLELANEYIGQIERLNPRLNALVDFDAERIREQVLRGGAVERHTRTAVRLARDGKGVDFSRRISLRNGKPRQLG